MTMSYAQPPNGSRGEWIAAAHLAYTEGRVNLERDAYELDD